MDISLMRAFFKWCTIINGALLIFSALLLRFAGVWVFGMHRAWIQGLGDSSYGALYLLLGFFKILVITFNLVPYIALVIIGRNQASRPA